MNYTISGDDETGYTVELPVWGKISKCPCCHKPLDTRRKAELLGENLILITGVPKKNNHEPLLPKAEEPQ